MRHDIDMQWRIALHYAQGHRISWVLVHGCNQIPHLMYDGWARYGWTKSNRVTRLYENKRKLVLGNIKKDARYSHG